MALKKAHLCLMRILGFRTAQGVTRAAEEGSYRFGAFHRTNDLKE